MQIQSQNVIHVSCHEPIKIVEALSKYATVKVSNISPADYVFYNTGIERKTISDFFQSWKTGRLFDQLSRMNACYPYTFLIIEAYDLSYFTKPMLVHNIILESILTLNCNVLYTRTAEETSELIIIMHKKATRMNLRTGCPPITAYAGINQHEPTILPKNMTNTHRKLCILQSIKGIGKKKANTILSNMNTLRDFFNASPKELKRRCGIGKRIYKEIQSVFD